MYIRSCSSPVWASALDLRVQIKGNFRKRVIPPKLIPSYILRFTVDRRLRQRYYLFCVLQTADRGSNNPFDCKPLSIDPFIITLLLKYLQLDFYRNTVSKFDPELQKNQQFLSFEISLLLCWLIFWPFSLTQKA